LNSR